VCAYLFCVRRLHGDAVRRPRATNPRSRACGSTPHPLPVPPAAPREVRFLPSHETGHHGAADLSAFVFTDPDQVSEGPLRFRL
jgi:hypothetical protein